ncbi:hypothetical protein [Phenylobacterium sp. 58.2.17]|uniref:hypothetical protein n=1 Tax=Phenylobacterium sp. 58.2.17 TaxID=2969306 RepID=UPI002264747B|nr:hypothetical protein [Phenylobacterium sp. 58.2.17]MCX7584875.1 hypothetical protein [Phenylobacterium sp. 58.2.17]
MHQFEDEVRATCPAPLQQTPEAPASAVGAQVITGATDATLKLDSRQFADAANTLRPPKAGARRPVVFAFNKDELRIVVKWDGATFWSRAPAALMASEPVAFTLPYEHFAHAARRWMKAGDLAGLRYSSADSLLEFSDHTHKPRPPSEHFFCVSTEEAKPDWNEIWAQCPGGVPFEPHRLAEVIRLLLAASSHANRQLARLISKHSYAPTKRRQDFGAVWITGGAGKIQLRSCHLEARTAGIDGLEFGIGRRDADTLIRTLALMDRRRRIETAEKAGHAIQTPRWAKVGDLNVITNGDVGFAFPNAEGKAPRNAFAAKLTSTLTTELSYRDFGGYFPIQQVLIRDMADPVTLVCCGDGQRLVVAHDQPQESGSQLVRERRQQAAACLHEQHHAGADFPKLNLLDFTRLVEAIAPVEIRLQTLKAECGRIWGLKLEQTDNSVELNAWIARTDEGAA